MRLPLGPPSQSPAPAGGYVGEVGFVIAFGVGDEMPRQVIGTLSSPPAGRFDFDPRNPHSPRKPLLDRPDMIRPRISLKGS